MVRFGVIGAGAIAKKFAETVNEMDLDLYAIASRSKGRAQDFKERYGFDVAYEGYDALFKDPDVDCVYIATPHALHHDQMMRALEHGKHVLCEKPFTLNAKEAREVFDKAKKKGLFVMEAMKPRMLPVLLKLKTLVDEGVIGDIVRLQVSFGFEEPPKEGSRILDPALGGGALLDIGIYPIVIANMFLGVPDSIESQVVKHDSGVDIKERITYHYPDARANLRIALDEAFHKNAVIYGTKGYIEIPHFTAVEAARITDASGGHLKTVRHPHETTDFEHEIRETVRCIEAGEIESPLNSHAMTLEVLRQMDGIRKEWGLVFPEEK